MPRRSAACAVLLAASSCLLAQSGGAPNHTNGNTTRTQTIHVGEPPTNHPGGNPGRTTGTTRNQSPFGPGSPAAGSQPANGSCAAATAQPGQLSLKANAPTSIMNFPVTYNGTTAAIGNLTVSADADQSAILCLLYTISRTNSGSALISAIAKESLKRNLFVNITKQDPNNPSPTTRPGDNSDGDILRAQPASLNPVWANLPVRPRVNGQPDYTADADVRAPVSFLTVKWETWLGRRGSGVGSTIRFSPSTFPLQLPGIQTATNAGADVGLVHELLHALRHLAGQANRTPVFRANDSSKADGTWLIVDEREIIGDSTVPSDWITENSYRRETGVAERKCVAPTCY